MPQERMSLDQYRKEMNLGPIQPPQERHSQNKAVPNESVSIWEMGIHPEGKQRASKYNAKKTRVDGIVYTASGAVAEEGVTIAPDWDMLPKGTKVYIEGIGSRIVQDRGGAIKGNMIDLYFNTHEEALRFGRQEVRLYIQEVTE